jgi:uncharacterized protein YbbK (DUF523 family)
VKLVSACLVGVKCNFAGGCFKRQELSDELAAGGLFPICPEVMGGLPSPRPPAEIQGGDGGDVLDGRARVVTIEGEDVTERFVAGARAALAIARALGADEAILIEKSPSCGTGGILDGSFSFTFKPGDGVAAALLKRGGIRVTRADAPPGTVERLSEEATG